MGGIYASSTFPSKVVEYAEHGMCIVATDISDVRALFGDAVLYVTGGDPDELVGNLRRLAADRALAERLATASHKVTEERLGEAAIGRQLVGFLFAKERE
jgi:glycosyltransferase involved in cell wall biosynthesis